LDVLVDVVVDVVVVVIVVVVVVVVLVDVVVVVEDDELTKSEIEVRWTYLNIIPDILSGGGGGGQSITLTFLRIKLLTLKKTPKSFWKQNVMFERAELGIKRHFISNVFHSYKPGKSKKQRYILICYGAACIVHYLLQMQCFVMMVNFPLCLVLTIQCG